MGKATLAVITVAGELAAVVLSVLLLQLWLC